MLSLQQLEERFGLPAAEPVPEPFDLLCVQALDCDRAPYPARTWFSAWAVTGEAPR